MIEHPYITFFICLLITVWVLDNLHLINFELAVRFEQWMDNIEERVDAWFERLEEQTKRMEAEIAEMKAKKKEKQKD